jgi:hypothetical protein
MIVHADGVALFMACGRNAADTVIRCASSASMAADGVGVELDCQDVLQAFLLDDSSV